MGCLIICGRVNHKSVNISGLALQGKVTGLGLVHIRTTVVTGTRQTPDHLVKVESQFQRLHVEARPINHPALFSKKKSNFSLYVLRFQIPNMLPVTE